jgi:hypothetical protein
VTTLLMSPLLMARTGRPRKDEGEKGTSQIRLKDDLVLMLSELLLVLPKGTTTAVLVDPFIREEITELHKQHKSLIEKVKAANQAAEDALLQARHEAELMKAREQKGSPQNKRKPGS